MLMLFRAANFGGVAVWSLTMIRPPKDLRQHFFALIRLRACYPLQRSQDMPCRTVGTRQGISLSTQISGHACALGGEAMAHWLGPVRPALAGGRCFSLWPASNCMES